MKLSYMICQTIFVIVISPFLSGLIGKIKNNIRMRKGPSVLQPYYNLAKLFSKTEVVSRTTSWIFSVTPYIVLGSAVTASFLVPVFASDIYMNTMGDIVLIIFIFALGRFFIALAGLDAGSAFGGMGSSREMFISSLAEPAMLLSLFTTSLNALSTSPGAISSAQGLHLSSIIAAGAFFIVMIAETARIPVDNRETHLELTMVHEAMVLEYSGRSLALIELAGHIKQAVLFSILVNLILPWTNIVFYILKILAVTVCIGLMEISIAKMRLFRVVDLLSFSFILSVLAVIVSAAGL